MAEATQRDGSTPSIRVFGGVGVDIDGEPVSIGGPRQRRLLALLAVRAGSVVDIDWLAENLWDDDDRPDATAPALRTYVSRLRQSLPADAQGWIATESAGYRLQVPDGAVESRRFAALRSKAAVARERDDPLAAQELLDEALALWRGDPFRELEDLDWARADIEQLNLDRLEMLEERWETALALGRHTQITGELATFTSEHGLRDRAARQYALALHRSGRTPEALRVIENHRRTVAEGTGLEPSAAIVDLEQALLTGDPSLDIATGGRPLRGYRLLEEAGIGAFAIVWRGFQPSVGREVAIKQIRSELASQPEFIRRFEAEAQLVARIEHPHIVPLIDFWRDPDSAYLVMRWLRGGTLERRLDDGPLSVAETLVLARQIGDALAAAHAHGVIHRDVKAGNILFDEAGNAFLGDFGIALEASQSAGPEAALSPGSPAYSSPEQIRRERLGPEADIFSLAVVVFECLTGELPFGAMAMPDLLDRQLHEPYPELSELRSDVPTSISAAVARATAKDPAQRFATVGEFLDALEPAAADRGSPEMSTAPIAATNPYKGLQAFDDGDTDSFFGRERLVNELVERLAGKTIQSRCVGVVGPSGSGKSSVVRAGLVPAIRGGAVPGSKQWFTTTMVPGTDPFESLEAALLRIAVNPPPSLLEQLQAGERGILRSVRRCLGSDDDRVLLVIDQFEEVFTAADAETAHQFLDALTVAVAEPTSPLRLALTLRADYYDRPLGHPAFAPVLKETAVDVTPLAPDELERAIVEPARLQGLRFEPGLVALIAAETIGQPAALPLLQYALSELFERREGTVLTVAAYEAIGGLSGALAARAEAIHDEADADQRRALRRVFGRLTNPTEELADLRRRVPVADVSGDAASTWVIDQLGGARLVTFDRDAGTREPTVEVAHEALLREWPRLVEWLREDAETLRSVDAIAAAATTWNEGGRAEADLHRGGRLETALGLAATTPDRLRPLDEEFIKRSAAAADSERATERRTVRRLRRLVAAVGVALVLALVAGGLAIGAQRRADDQARDAELATLISRSAAQIGQDPKVALLLALEAHQRSTTAETEQAVLNALVANTRSNNVSKVGLVVDPTGNCQLLLRSPDAMVDFTVAQGQLVTRDPLTGIVDEYGPPPEDCVAWFGDPAANRRWAGSGDGRRMWFGPLDGPWEVERTFSEPTYLIDFEFKGTGVLLFRSGPRFDQLLTLVDDETGASVGTPYLAENLERMVTNADGSLIALSRAMADGAEGFVTVLDGRTLDLVAEVATPTPAQVLTFDPSGGQLLAGIDDGLLLTIDTATWRTVSSVAVTTSEFLDIGVRPDGLVVATSGSQIEIVDRRTGPTGASVGLRNVVDAWVRPDGTVQTVSFEDESVEIIDLDVSALVERSWRVDAATTWSLGSSKGVSIGPGGAELIELETGERSLLEMTRIDGAPFEPTAVIPTDAGLMAIDDGAILTVDAGGAAAELIDLGGPIVSVNHAGGLVAAVVGSGRSRASTLLRIDDGGATRLLVVEGDFIVDAQPGPDGGLYLLDGSGVVHSFDPAGNLDETFDTGLSGASVLGLDVASGELAVAATDGVVVVDPETGSFVALAGAAAVAGLAFVHGADQLAVSTLDGTVRLWDTSDGRVVGTVWSGSGSVAGAPLWFDQASGSMWLGSSGLLVQVPLTPERWVEQACAFLNRDLTDDEWERFVPGSEPLRSACRTGLIGPEWEQGINASIPPGTVRLPELGGISFELGAERDVLQDRAYTIVAIEDERGEWASEVDLIEPTATGTGEPLEDIDQLVDALVEDVAADLTELEELRTPLGPVRVFDYVIDQSRFDPGRAWLQVGPGGWSPLPFGRFWLFDTERGLFMVTAEALERDALLDEAISVADLLVATIELVDIS